MKKFSLSKERFSFFKILCLFISIFAVSACGGGDKKPSQSTVKVNKKSVGGADSKITIQAASTDGSISTQNISFSPNVTTACDSKWVIRILGIHRSRQLLPTLMHSASCKTANGTTKMFTSLTVKEGQAQSGMIIESILDASGKMVPKGSARKFEECLEMNGIAVSSDCSVVGALCRRDGNPSISGGFTKDMVAAIPDTNKRFRDWISQTNRSKFNDEQWLYDWANGDISKKPSMYVANKAIGNWELGKQDLVYSNEQNSYGLSLEASAGTHDGDSFLVVNRSDFSIDTKRGWLWACGAGHTLQNHATFNSATGKYAAICLTDLGSTLGKSDGYGGLWVKVEGNKSNGFLSIPVSKQNYAGGVTGILPLKDGGFLGVFAGTEATSPKQEFRDKGPTTKIGIARFDTVGKLVGNINWVVKDDDWFYSYPQLASLGNDKYLLGYAKMVRLSKRNELGIHAYGDAIRLPDSFHVIEIDQNGKKLTPEQTVKYGWGEQDRMVSLEDGKVAWAYIPKAQYSTETSGKKATLPKCDVNEISLNVYTNKSMK